LKGRKEKMEKNKITLFVGAVLFVTLIAGVGCASKGFVREEVAALDQKVEGVETSVEENQKRAKFKFDSYELNDEAKIALDVFVQKLVEENRGVYLEIQGHTDSSGPEDWNLILGKKRAEAVMEYLHKKYSIPLHRMEVISYGSGQPVGDNSMREGRTQNRRVVILVYE
jgi:outer membrane protein OmpA-like peptidoglycan-associated protein